MPKEAFGGDDEGSGGAEERKKPALTKFGLAPDTNIRDVFWKIMASYAATKKAGVGLQALENDRFALMRVALSVLSSPDSGQYGLSPRFVATYTLMMLFDGGWKDALVEFLEKGIGAREGTGKNIALSLEKLVATEGYRPAVIEELRGMLRNRQNAEPALGYLAQMKSRELMSALKKELMILARGDIGKNQLNAIKALSLIKEDDEVKKSLIILLSHWDAEPRFMAAEALKGLSEDEEVKAAARKKLGVETDSHVKKILEKIVN